MAAILDITTMGTMPAAGVARPCALRSSISRAARAWYAPAAGTAATFGTKQGDAVLMDAPNHRTRRSRGAP